APNMAARDAQIARLERENPNLYAENLAHQRQNDGIKHFIHESGGFPLTSYGRLNTSSLFAEISRILLKNDGRAGLVLPTGIATDSFNQFFFTDLIRNRKLVSFLDFENEAFLLSSAVHHSFRFCLLTVCGRRIHVDQASFAFSTRYLRDLHARRFTIPPEEILLVNPNTGTIPVFGSRQDAEITLGIYKRVPILWRDDPTKNPWALSFQLMFMMNTDSGLFHRQTELLSDGWILDGNVFVHDLRRKLPLYEAKMVHHFDHRYGTYEGQTQAQANMGTLPRLTPEQRTDPDVVVMPRYWVQEFDTPDEQRSKPEKLAYHLGVTSRLETRHWNRGWLLGWRDICRSSDERTIIASAIPRSAVGDKFL